MSKAYVLQTKKYSIKLYEPPSKETPVDEKVLKKLKEIKKTMMTFRIEESQYNIDNLDGFFGEEEPPKKTTDKKPKPDEKKPAKDDKDKKPGK
jgi:hypothetical protein